jgi:hypothetical protein
VKVATDLRASSRATESLNPRTCLVCPDGGSEWKPAADYDVGLMF